MDRFEIMPDRRAAIRYAVAQLNARDILLVAGKGHETGQIFATHTDPFNDVNEVEAAITALNSATPRSTALPA